MSLHDLQITGLSTNSYIHLYKTLGIRLPLPGELSYPRNQYSHPLSSFSRIQIGQYDRRRNLQNHPSEQPVLLLEDTLSQGQLLQCL